MQYAHHILVVSWLLLSLTGVSGAEIQVIPGHPVSKLEGLEILDSANGVLQLQAQSPTSGVVAIQSSQPLVIRSATNAEARLEPGWDGTVGYSHYRLVVTALSGGKLIVRLETIPPPTTPVVASEKELAEFGSQFRDRPSRFSNDPRGFAEWQRTWRAKLAALLMARVQAGVAGCILSTWNHYHRRFRIPPHCDCGISFQLGPHLEQCDWAALAAPKPMQFQHGRQDAACCPGADPKRLDLQWNTGVMPQAEYDMMFAEVKRAYGLAGNADATETWLHDGPHKVDNEAAFTWLNRWLDKASN